MAERYVYFGAVTYDDADGVHRSAYQGDLIKFSSDDEKRLDGLGALYPKDWNPDAAEQQAAAEATAPLGPASELQRARQEVARRDAVIADLQQQLAAATGGPPPSPQFPGPPGSPGKPTEDEQREARNAARRAAAAAAKADKPSTKASAAKAAKSDQAATGQPIASDPFDPTQQTPPVVVNPDTGQPLAEQPGQ